MAGILAGGSSGVSRRAASRSWIRLTGSSKREEGSECEAAEGFPRASVLEIVEDFDTDTYRAVYTVRFEEAVYVLHCSQKKSKSGISTPKQDIELIEKRLKQAEKEHQLWQKEQNTLKPPKPSTKRLR